MNIWLKALLILVAVIVAIKISAFAATGTTNLGFVQESSSMEPNMHVGDLILVQSHQRTDIITYAEGKMNGYKSFGDYGDVIIFHPNGISSATPIMHRAISWVEKGEEMPDGKPAPHEGYITKGDNNAVPDQSAFKIASGKNAEPVKPEWIKGVARVRVPYLGFLLKGIGGTVVVLAVVYAIIVGCLMRKPSEKK